jgi:S1-C subfamily serine protease
MKRSLKVATGVMAISAAIVVGGFVGAIHPVTPASAANQVTPVDQSDRLADEQNTIDIVKKFGPSVVAINVTVEGERVNPLANLPPQLRQFFNQNGQGSPFSGPQKFTERAAGSGFVIDDKGEIITNYHVFAPSLKQNSAELKSSATVTIRFQGSKEDLPATVIGADRAYDLALLKLKDPDKRPADAKPIAFADSNTIQVGQKAIAIGNPFTLQSTVTEGIVSAVDRRQAAEVSGVPIDYVQTDAAINPGNSGGPLLDSRGRLIGVNDEILAPNGTFVGVGFAIPSNLVKERLAKLRQGGFIMKAQLGVSIIDINDYPAQVRKFLSLPDKGVMVVGIAKGSPAEKAGIQPAQYTVSGGGRQWPAGGDIIVQADGKPVNSAEELQNTVYAREAGDSVKLQLLHDGEKKSVTVKLEVLKKESQSG